MSSKLLGMVLTAALVLLANCSALCAQVKSRTIRYASGEVELEGYFAWDDEIKGARPGVLIVHAWWGLGDDEKARARQLAELGYAAFALDMYGNGKFTQDPQVASGWAGPFYADRQLARSRVRAGLDVLATQAETDADRLAAIGYCFGGSMVIELAFSGAPVDGVVSFHGNPLPALQGDAARTDASLLVCHGAADALVPMESVTAFTDSLEGSTVDWQLIIYSGAQHSFTTKSVDEFNIPGARYSAAADRRSWSHMRDFLDEVFAR